MNIIGERLRKERDGKGLIQDQVADYLKVKRQTYSAYERGVSIPDALTLQKLADYFEVSTDYLLGKSDDRMAGTSYATPVILKSSQAILDIIDTLSEEKKEKLLELAKMLQTVEEAEKGNKK